MKTLCYFFLIFSLIYSGFGLDYRGIFGNWFNSNNNNNNNNNNNGNYSPCNGCPYRNCLNDRAVILGYCCGCARVSDFLPLDCATIPLNCPHDGRRLCRDYDYMLNCCCP